jgi:hypothetical protein
MELFFLSLSIHMSEMMVYFNVSIWQQRLFNSNGLKYSLGGWISADLLASP